MPEEIATLRRKRGAVKAKLTSFNTFLNSVATKYTESPALVFPEREASEFEHRLEVATKYLGEFESLHFDIVALLDDNEVEEATSLAEFQNIYFGKIAEAKDLLKRLNLQAGRSIQSVVPSNVVPPSTVSNLQNVKLPQIKLPTFSGSYNEWMEYKDTFDSLINSNPQLSNSIDKFHYLRASLTGEALQLIKHIEFSNQNYNNAWNILCDRYDNKTLLIKNHLKAIFEMEPMSKSTVSDLRRIFDTFTKNLRCLKTLGEPVDYWGTLLVYIAMSKLDNLSVEEWEKFRYSSNNSNNVQESNYDLLLKFLKNRAELLDTMQVSKLDKSVERSGGRPNIKSFVGVKTESKFTSRCSFCKGEHFTKKCPEFLKLSINDRIARAKQQRLCINCLRSGHFVKNCSSSNCRHCNGRHHSLLHLKPEEPANRIIPAENVLDESVSAVSSTASQHKHVLLSTAKIYVVDVNGKQHVVRALLDNGSQANYITANLCKHLLLPTNTVSIRIDGINSCSSNISASCIVRIASIKGGFKFNLNCLVVPQITGTLPNFSLDDDTCDIPQNIKLADPSFLEPSEIDILLGSELFWKLIRVGQIQLSNGPILQNTSLGWIVSGPIQSSSVDRVSVQSCHSTHSDLNQQLEKFWEIHEPVVSQPRSPEEMECEELFKRDTFREPSGRFVVSLPFKQSTDSLGDSRQLAEKMLLSLERRLQRNDNLRLKYLEFMQTYEDLGHMSKVENDVGTGPAFYFPHHGVLNESSLTTKLRVVFNGSAKTDTGVSLNDLQMVGPVIQNDLISILIRFRFHRYVITADIEKMYRQVLVKQEHRRFQKILWRKSPSLPIDTFELNTVTYGTTAASFLAIRCLYQLALDYGHSDPTIAQIIKNDFYVDDLITGASDVEEAQTIVERLVPILQSGGFPLRKWVSNESSILKSIPSKDKTSSLVELNADPNIKTLGLLWNPKLDSLCFSINLPRQDIITKRSILSTISRIFDPLGILGPSTILSKILIQKLWMQKIDWDSGLPLHLHQEWSTYSRELPLLNLCNIPRHVAPPLWDLRNCRVELHCFSDASELAYGSCVYIRVINTNNEIHVALLASKARVTPLKTSTIPRLELCGALVMVNLLDKINTSIAIPINRVYCWVDSTIVLGWIKSSPSQFQIFVANRVSQIQNLSKGVEWRHVPTQDNPADSLSRGVMPASLRSLRSWWKGPSWLQFDSSCWPQLKPTNQTLPEIRKVQTNVAIVSTSCQAVFKRFSKLSKLERVMSYVKRFFYNCRTPANKRLKGPLSVQERKDAFLTLIKIAQRDSFKNETQLLVDKRGDELPSRLISLRPFLDSNGLIRIGGRISQSDYPYSKKHPILLTATHRFSRLLFENEHNSLLHAGPQMLLASMRERFWVLRGRNLARMVARSCVRCFRVNPRTVNPLMGNLPSSRITPSPPFSVTGLDYAGPFIIKDRLGRGSRNSKCYLCLFVCFSTKAVHLELVSALTTEAFIAALRRFSSRRGLPLQLHSDNGTTFVGAKSELNALGSFLKKNYSDLAASATELKMDWKFIPAYSPHFGGIWEAGVKSAKFHLKRIAGNAALTFEQLSTLFTQIEAILNSRPLTPISTDPNDLSPLTPSHFLIGKPLTAVPDGDWTSVPENRLSKFQRLQQLQQHFWGRWKKEYVSELQQLVKWRKNSSNLAIDALVLLKDDRSPPMHWSLGRVIAVHPGTDNIVRCATIKTSTGTTKRCVSKLCPLPTEDSD